MGSGQLVAHYREPRETCARRIPPAHLSQLPPCAHCGGSEWRWHLTQNCWLCLCYWHPEMRRAYHQQDTPDVAPRQAPLPVSTEGAIFMCNRAARPGKRCTVVLPGEHPWWNT